MADELFNQADLNNDQRLDLNEFRNFLAQSLARSSNVYGENFIDGNQYSTGFYETSLAGSVPLVLDGVTGAGNNAASGSYEQVSYSGSTGDVTRTFDPKVAIVDSGVAKASTTAGTTTTTATGGVNAIAGAGVTGVVTEVSSSSTVEAGTNQQQVEQYAASSQGLFQDPNPQIVRRPAQAGQVTYTQNIKIRFLQPPPIPPPGPLIIKEIRPPQPPPPPPLVVRQRAPPLPTPPPLILRERPPAVPPAVAAQTVIRKLPPLPVPPRSVIIERLPPLPPKPRDIIIERWIPYGAMAKRKTIVQRAEPPKPYPKPRNIIIQYEAPQVRIVRQFQRLGVTAENPQEYVQRYGTSLIDTQTLMQQARAAGVVEDISPPANLVTTVSASSTSLNADFVTTTSGAEQAVTGGRVAAVNTAPAAAATAAASSSSYESSNFIGQQGPASFSGYESVQGIATAGLASPYGASSYLSQGAAAFNDINATGYQEYTLSTGSNNDQVNTLFQSADLNQDGTLDPQEFQRFLQTQFQ